MRIALVLAALALVGCQSEVDREEQAYAIVEKGRDSQAKCEQARKVAAAYLSAGNAGQYERWKLRANIQCEYAETNRALGLR